MDAKERLYASDQIAGWKATVWRDMINEILVTRELIWRLFRRDFAARYRQSLLGILGALVPSLMAVGTFVFLNRAGILNVGDTGVPYPVYAFLGLTIWQIFAGGLNVTCNAVVASSSMVIKINFPKEALLISAMGHVIFDFLIRLAFLALILVIYQVPPKLTVIWLPFTLLPLFLLTLGLGSFLSLLQVLVRDVSNMVTMATTLLMLLTPVLYPVPQSGWFVTLAKVNPLAPLIVASKDMVITGHLTDPWGFAWASALALLFFLLAWRVFHLVEYKIAEIV
ncbi:MAG: hypothetical protein A2Y80_03115 [Deltaproteobacteria bacterium RBG_13_58_19]|nr:MAG: hypothetical protein A2Y80_03115 [Deltaproteobacteria bacterium RBG_13_58_19]